MRHIGRMVAVAVAHDLFVLIHNCAQRAKLKQTWRLD
jgi:hypothetical protein